MTPEQVVGIITGVATLINSLILWPIVKSLKRGQTDLKSVADNLDTRVKRLERSRRKAGAGK